MPKRSQILVVWTWLVWPLACLMLACGSKTDDGMEEIFITTSSDQARNVFHKALAAYEEIQFAQARELFDRALRIDPEFAMAHLYRAFCSPTTTTFQHHIEKAHARIDHVTPGEKTLIQAWYAYAVDDQPGEGIRLMQQVIADFPKDKRAHWSLGLMYYNQDEDDLAIEALRKAIDVDPDYAAAYNMLGYTYAEKGEFDKAEEAFKNYIRVLPDAPNPHDSLADLYSRMGRYEDAIRHYRKALELDPAFATSQRKIGTNLVYLGKFEEARRAFRKAMQLESSTAGKLNNLMMIANSYLYQGKFELADQACDEVIRMATEYALPEWAANGHATRCEVLIAMGELDKAEKSLTACRQVVANSELMKAARDNLLRQALFDEALIATRRGDFEKAWQLADQHQKSVAASGNPRRQQEHHALLGQIYLAQQEPEMAVKHLEQANREDPQVLFYLAQACDQAGQRERAAELYQKVAGWNQHSLGYALVRSRAIEEADRRVAAK